MFKELTEELLDLMAEEKGGRHALLASPAVLCLSLCTSCSCSRPPELE